MSRPNPGPKSPDLSDTVYISNPTTDEFRILQLNCNGLTRKITEITDFMDRKDIKIAAIQETKLTSRNKLTDSSNYTLIRLDRDRNAGGGKAFILHNSIKYNPLATVINDDHLEVQGISVKTCKTGYIASIQPLLSVENRVIVGNFNAHHNSCIVQVHPGQ